MFLRGLFKYAVNFKYTLRKVDQKYLENFKLLCWRKMEISWTDRVRNEEVMHRGKEDSNILYTIKRRESSSVGHILQEYFLKEI